MDRRDETAWLIVELTPQGERVAEEGLLEEILRDYGDLSPKHPIFIPYLTYTYGGSRSLFSVMEGYAFLGAGLSEYSRRDLTNTPYIKRFLSRQTDDHFRPLDTISDSAVQDLKKRLGELIGVELEEGMKVRVCEGSFIGLQGVIVGVSGESATVLVELRSLRALRKMPRFMLRPQDDNE